MSTMSIRMPNSLHERLREFVRKDNVSINQFITSAVTWVFGVLKPISSHHF
jgi:predicted HicB family RNase H-like nuclease